MMKSSIRMTEAKEVLMDTKREAMPNKLLTDNIKWIKETMETKISKNKKKFFKKRLQEAKSTIMVKLKKLSRNKSIGLMSHSHQPRMVRKEKRNETIFPINLKPNFCMYIHLSE